MTRRNWPQSCRVWFSITLLLSVGTALSAILAAATLEMLMHRPSGGGSMTTMLPGAVYAMATVMKTCVAWSAIAALVTAGTWISARTRRQPAADVLAPPLPVWGLACIALVVLTPWIGAGGAVIAQAFTGSAQDLSLGELPQISRVAVFVQFGSLATGALSAAVSLAKHEHPRLMALLGVAASGALIVLFWHFEFHAPGFDQDTWAPR